MARRSRAKGWEVWSKDDGDYFIDTFADKGNAQRRIERLQRSHPHAHYFLKHRTSPTTRHFERRRDPSRERNRGGKYHAFASPKNSRAHQTDTAQKRAQDFLREGQAAEKSGHFASASVWYEKAAREYDKLPNGKIRARLWHKRAKDVKSNRRMGTLYRSDRDRSHKRENVRLKRLKKEGRRTWDRMQRPSEHHRRKSARRDAAPRLSSRKARGYPYSAFHAWLEKGNRAALAGHHASAAVSFAHVAKIERQHGSKSVARKYEKRAAEHRKAARHGHGIGAAISSRDARKVHHHRTKGAPPFKTQTKIGRKIRLLREEGYPPKQAAAIAYRMYGASRPSRDPSDSYTTQIYGHPVRVTHHPKTGRWSTAVIGRSGAALPGPSARSRREAEEAMRELLRHQPPGRHSN